MTALALALAGIVAGLALGSRWLSRTALVIRRRTDHDG